MRIVRHERANTSTVLYLEMDDGTLHAHCILDGILEDRQEAWDLPDDVDPIDLILIESHYASEEMPEPFAPGFAANREKVLALINEHKANISGKTKELRTACQLPVDASLQLRKRLRAQFGDVRGSEQPTRSLTESLQRTNDNIKQIRLGTERLAQERLADEMVAASPELKRALRNQPDDGLGLVIKYV